MDIDAVRDDTTASPVSRIELAPPLPATESLPPARSASAAGAGPAGATGAALRLALLDSRQRWRDLVLLAADLVFETDAQGHLAMLAPGQVLGWDADALLGRPATILLADGGENFGGGEGTGFNPFAPAEPVRRRRAWLRHADGATVCLEFAAEPLRDSNGRIVGARGLGQDVTRQNQQDNVVAATLRRGEMLDHILLRMRREVLAPRMMQATLEAIAGATGAEGCAVVDLLSIGALPTVLHHLGDMAEPALLALATLAPETLLDGSQVFAADGRPVLLCPSETRYGEQAGLMLWRKPGSRAWDDDEVGLIASASWIIRVILEHEAIQREMARQARTDPLTGLLNRRAFLDEIERRIGRLEHERLPGTLMFVDLDHFKALNDKRGHAAGDEALCLTANLLRATVRPTDLVARLGGDEFALWLDGADQLTAAERAETLRVDGPKLLAHLCDGEADRLTMSIGIATRQPGGDEDIELLMHRADQAMYAVKRGGRGHWRVSRDDGRS